MTPKDLVEAAKKGDVDAVRAALDAGIAVDAPEGEHVWCENALFAAAGAGHLEVIALLLDRGADIHRKGPADMTALHSAVRDGRLEAMKLLLERGAPESERVLNDVIHVAKMTAKGHPDAPQILHDHRLAMVKPAAKGDDAQAKLQVAAEAGDLAALDAALEAGADACKRDGRGMEPLSWASLRGHVAVIQKLLEAGADPNQETAQGWPPLGQAAGQGHAEAIRALIAGGADPNRAFDGGRTALMCAAHGGRTEAVDALLEAGAEASRSFQGQTAESLARMQGHTELAAKLTSAGEWKR